MSETEFDTALVTAAFRLAGEDGWRKVNAVAAARAAGLSLAEARARFPSRAAILLRFGRLADQAALQDVASEGSVRDRLFDLLMRRFDMLQANRAGVKALLRTLPTDPPAALLLAVATRRSMRWMLQAAGVNPAGPRGELQVRALLAVWLWGVRAWERDPSEDLSHTMAAIDTALGRAERVASWLQGQRRPPSAGAGESDDAPPPEGTALHDTAPEGTVPEGTAPEDMTPAGIAPDAELREAAPPDAVPPGAVPPGAGPPGTAPPDVAPPKAAPPEDRT
jgi:ubiquinone biosynthesis protein COQ9